MTSVAGAAGAIEPVDVARLRHPHEQIATLVYILLNVAILVLAVVAIDAGSAWLAEHPRAAPHLERLRPFVLAALFAGPAAVLGRHTKLYGERANGVRISEEQLPELHAEIRRACDRLGVSPVPELYVRRGLDDASRAFSVLGRRSAVILDAELFERNWHESFDCIAFAIANAVGTIRLGHTRWWIEILTAYAVRVPILKNQILSIWTFSRDRCAAYVVPNGVRGLIITAAGKTLIENVDVGAFVRQAERGGGFWEWVAGLGDAKPDLLARARALYACGLFDLDRDLRRSFGRDGGAPPAG